MKIIKSKYIVKIFLIIIPFTISSCERIGLCNDEALSIDKKNYTKTILRIDGLYYGEPDTAYDGKVTFNTIVFYSNGVVLRPGNVEFHEIENYVGSMNHANNNRNTKYIWGLFDFSDEERIIEYWRPAQCGYPVVRNSCDLVNDTTFIITSRKVIENNSEREYKINTTYRFKRISQKPDSTNNFIK